MTPKDEKRLMRQLTLFLIGGFGLIMLGYFAGAAGNIPFQIVLTAYGILLSISGVVFLIAEAFAIKLSEGKK